MDKTYTLFIDEDRIKEMSSISENVSGKYITSSIREAQEMDFKRIVGQVLYEKLCSLVSTRDIYLPQYASYKALIDEAQDFIGYTAIVDIIPKVSYKVGNFGLAKSNDENLQVVTHDEIVKMQFYYQAKADAHCKALQNWLLENRKEFPELTENRCHKIKSNLRSSAFSSIFLGGERGKQRR